MRPRVDFRTTPLDAGRTEVALDFEVDLPVPPPLRQVVGIAMGRWARGLHRKELDQLKTYVETAGDHHITVD